MMKKYIFPLAFFVIALMLLSVSIKGYVSNNSGITGQEAQVIGSPDIGTPAGFRYGNITSSSILLGWTPPMDESNIVGYRIFRSVSPAEPVLLTTVTTMRFTDTGLAPSTLYTYKIAAIDAQGNESLRPSISVSTIKAPIAAPVGTSTSSGLVTPTPVVVTPVTPVVAPPFVVTPTPTPPVVVATTSTVTLIASLGRPIILSALPTINTIALTWIAPSQVAGAPVVSYFKIYRNGIYVASTTGRTFLDTGLNSLTSYRYEVSSYTSQKPASESGKSLSMSALTLISTIPGETVSVATIGGGDSDYGYGVGSDNAGNLYVSGLYGLGTGYLEKRSPTGVVLWATTAFSLVNSIAVNKITGDVFITGEAFQSDDNHVVVAKYDTNGVLKWTNILGGQGGGFHTVGGKDIAIDSQGNVAFVASVVGQFQMGDTTVGRPTDSASYSTNLIAKLNGTTGTVIWVKPLYTYAAGTYTGQITGMAISADQNNNFFFAGISSGTLTLSTNPLITVGAAGQSSKFVIAKIDSLGNYQWAKGYGSVNPLADYPWHMTVDSSGNPVVAGLYKYNTNLGGANLPTFYSDDIFVVKYSSTTGSHIWSKGFGSDVSSKIGGVSVDADSNVYVSGRVADGTDFGGGPMSISGNAAVIAKLSPTGEYVPGLSWQRAVAAPRGESGGSVTVGNFVYWLGKFSYTTDFGSGISKTSVGNSVIPDMFLVKLNK